MTLQESGIDTASVEALNRATVMQQYNGFINHDLDAIMKTFDDECVFYAYDGPDINGRCYVGKAAIRGAFEQIFRDAPHCTWRDPSFLSAGNHVIARWTFVFSNKDKVAFTVEGIDDFELLNGKVKSKNNWLKKRSVPIRIILALIFRRFVSAVQYGKEQK